MLVRSYHAKKHAAKKEAKKWEKQGLKAIVIPGDKSLDKRMSFFVVTEEKTKESFKEKYARVSKEFFPENTGDKPKETIEEKLARANKVFE